MHAHTIHYYLTQWLFFISDKMADILAREEPDDACLRDSISIASTDSFVSAAEVREALAIMPEIKQADARKTIFL